MSRMLPGDSQFLDPVQFAGKPAPVNDLFPRRVKPCIDRAFRTAGIDVPQAAVFRLRVQVDEPAASAAQVGKIPLGAELPGDCFSADRDISQRLIVTPAPC